MENKAKIGFLILLIFYIILAESEMWGPVIITGDTPAEAILKLSNTPAAVSAESVLVKRYDSTVSSYPINNIKTTKIQWDSVTSKPTAYNPVLHQHDSIYYRETEVNNLLSSKSDTSHTHPQSKINGLVDTITNHRNAIASKFATADTNKLARKSHIHNIADVTSLQTALDSKQPLDSDLTAIAGLTHSNRNVLISDGSTWTRRALVADDLPNISAAKITSGTLSNDRLSFNPDYFVQGTNSRRSIAFGANNLDNNRYSTFFNMYNIDPAYSGLPGGVVMGLRSQHAENSNYSLEIVGYPGSHLYFGGLQNNVRQVWRQVWHEGNFDPSTKANATHSHPWGDITGKPSTFAPASHTLLGHTASGLTTGHVLKALSANTYGFGAIAWSEIASKPSTFTPSVHSHPWSEITDKPSTFTPSAHNHGTGTTNYIPIFTNGATGAIGNSQLVQYTDGVVANKGLSSMDYLQSMGPLYVRSHILLYNKPGNDWLYFATRDESGSEPKFNLSNIGSIDGVGPITLSDGVGGYFQLYNNSGQGRAMLKTKDNTMCFTVETSTLPAADAITINRDAGSLGAGIPKVDIDAVTSMNEKVYIQSDVNISNNSLVSLSGAVRYNYIQAIASVPTIDTDDYPGIYLITDGPNDHTLSSEIPDQRIFVGNRSTRVKQVEGYRIEPGQFRDFIKTSTGWIASGASISGKTISVIHGTGNISVSNVSTVHINYSPTSTYTLTDGYVGQRVTVVVLGSAQHWIQGATKGHKIVPGEFRDFIYTTDGWVASAADY